MFHPLLANINQTKAKMEIQKTKASPKKLKTSLCIPRLQRGNNNYTNKSKSLSPVTLLERFREAVFRLIMLSAMSKDTNNTSGSTDNIQRCHYPNDPHHSEAVADCIEFIKKKASTDENRDSSASSSSIHASPEVILPVSVM